MAIETTNNQSAQTGKIPLPVLDMKEFKSENDLAELVIEKLKVAGVCVLRNSASPEEVRKISHEMTPYLKDRWDFFAFEDRFTMSPGLLTLSETYSQYLDRHVVWQKVCNYFLTHTYGPYWAGENQYTTRTNPQISFSTGLRLGPGTSVQHLHRDDAGHHGWNQAAKEHTVGRDVTVGLFTACTEATRANGTTKVLPGSHLWDYSIAPPASDSNELVDVVMDPGDCYLMLGGVYHGHGANTTEEYRLITTTTCTTSLHSQRENQFLAHDVEKVRALPLRIQRLMGYNISESYSGYVHLKDPLRVIGGEDAKYNDAPCHVFEQVY
ncbi:hypothetical protein CDV55_106277 [Aspergillus turcosus]|nr:hypothetical protein CDV55_106277 [Aspergillus turcosus]